MAKTARSLKRGIDCAGSIGSTVVVDVWSSSGRKTYVGVLHDAVDEYKSLPDSDPQYTHLTVGTRQLRLDWVDKSLDVRLVTE